MFQPTNEQKAIALDAHLKLTGIEGRVKAEHEEKKAVRATLKAAGFKLGEFDRMRKIYMLEDDDERRASVEALEMAAAVFDIKFGEQLDMFGGGDDDGIDPASRAEIEQPVKRKPGRPKKQAAAAEAPKPTAPATKPTTQPAQEIPEHDPKRTITQGGIYDEGVAAGMEGKEEADCPYSAGSIARGIWMSGLTEGKKSASAA